MNDVPELVKELTDSWNQTKDLAEQLEKEIHERKNDSLSKLKDGLPPEADEEKINSFLDKPYIIRPRKENEYEVIVPRFIPFNVGWLHKQTEAYNVFIVNKYVDWINPLPEEIKNKVGIDKKFEQAIVDGNTLTLDDEEEAEYAWNELGGRDGGLYKKEGRQIQITKGSEFEVIAKIIDSGNLPFKPTPIDNDDLRPEPSKIQLDNVDKMNLKEGVTESDVNFQTRAWKKFKETGMVGIYWPPGSGKTFMGLYAGERIKGKKLVVVPSRTLKEQWKDAISGDIDKYPGVRNPDEWEVQTYQYLTRYNNLEDYQNQDIALTIMDEVHTLPSNTHSKLSTLNTKYRIGLTASPHREDGRENYIFALTGFPVGLQWDELISIGAVNEPDVKVKLYKTMNKKDKGIRELAKNISGKTIIFCDSINKGKQLSSDLGAPFIYGETNDRLEKIRNNHLSVVSRVGDEGMSIPEIDNVIEYDFLFGSKRQSLQRSGRVMHKDEGSGRHIILMTDEELKKYEKRLYSLEDKGFNIDLERA